MTFHLGSSGIISFNRSSIVIVMAAGQTLCCVVWYLLASPSRCCTGRYTTFVFFCLVTFNSCCHFQGLFQVSQKSTFGISEKGSGTFVLSKASGVKAVKRNSQIQLVNLFLHWSLSERPSAPQIMSAGRCAHCETWNFTMYMNVSERWMLCVGMTVDH